MKADIHPQIHPVIFVDTSTGAEFVTTSTLTSEQKKKVNGVDHYVIKVEISSTSHPFYTGKRKLVDTAGRVDRFRARAERAKKIQEKNAKAIDEGLDEVLHKEEEEKAEKKTEKKEEKAEIKTDEKGEEKAEKKAPAKKAAPKKKTAAKKTTTKAKKEEK